MPDGVQRPLGAGQSLTTETRMCSAICVASTAQPMPMLNELHLGAPAPRIGIFGGSFNPVHNGHIDIALRTNAEFDLLNVQFVVGGDPPHKRPDSLAPKRMRMDMVELATLDLPPLRPNGIEMHQDTPTYTVQTMRLLREQFPDTDFLFIIGEDSLYQLDTWHEIRELCRMVEFICVRRPAQSAAREITERVRELEERYDAVIHLSKFAGPPISSTMVRERVARGQSIRGLVPPSVEEYINATGLYK